MADVRSYFLVLGEREAIRWVVTTGRMAFPSTPRREVASLRAGDELFLLTTRGAFHNPTRDRTRVVGTATVLTAASTLDLPVELAGRSFHSGCDLKVTSLAPYLHGLEVAPIAATLESLLGQEHWGMLLRRPLVPVTEADALLLRKGLEPHLVDIGDAVATYRDHIRPVGALH